MRALLLILSLLALGNGFLISALAKSAVHEIEAFLFYLIAAVLFSAFALLHSIIRVRESMDALQQKVSTILDTIAPIAAPPVPIAPSDSSQDLFVVQLNDGTRSNFTREQLDDLLQRGSIDQRTWLLPPGEQKWIMLSQFAARRD